MSTVLVDLDSTVKALECVGMGVREESLDDGVDVDAAHDDAVHGTTHDTGLPDALLSDAPHPDAACNGTTHPLLDISVQFIGARGLSKMDIIGLADPYFIATIDDKIKFTSSVQANTLTPVWNAMWHVMNVPRGARMKVMMYDKDMGLPSDDYIGTCELPVEDGTKETDIEGSFKRKKGTFWTKITTSPASSPSLPGYTFAGPTAYSRHSSPTLGLLTQVDSPGKRLYSTWKVRIKGVPAYLGDMPPQQWNTAYPAAQRIFGTSPTSCALRSSIQGGHRMLYARSTQNAFGTIETREEALALLCGGRAAPRRVKPAVYTYVVCRDDDTLRFSETGAAFFVDFASKHALHANCAETVWYSGEFHPRPQGGWAVFDEGEVGEDGAVGWELVVDNNSGTYAPDRALLPRVGALIEENFPGFEVVVLDRDDPALAESREACRAYAVRWRGVRNKELRPNKHEKDEETLRDRASKISHS